MKDKIYGFSFQHLGIQEFCTFVERHKDTIKSRNIAAELLLLKDVEASSLSMPFSEVVLNHVDTIHDDQNQLPSLYAIISNVLSTESKLPIQCIPQANDIYYIGVETSGEVTYDIHAYMESIKDELRTGTSKAVYGVYN